ncbi:glycerate kinase [Litoribacter alkaliphilus]|uniref:Glycerate kinase n=1 Tax=Litoribacter ruber TaxID=702568 RepID=A0AAP2CHD9_9BACT|nr:glycerate kinase [Litoribacter alkaliphilus]MBS9524758.1 glycerate kinase [Litoribacter alkaliphilus]
MKILIAPNAFKGTMKAGEAAEIIRTAILDKHPDYDIKACPIADGGDGTCLLLTQAMGLEKRELLALDPLGRPVKGFYGWDIGSEKAFVDVSTVSGVGLLKAEERDPFITCTYGTGELIKAAYQEGAREIELGLGGSATIDMGVGILNALGFKFLNQWGREVAMFSPYFLDKIKFIQRPIEKLNLKFSLLCDVQNQFLGPAGAVPVFGPQKGLEAERVEEMEGITARFFEMLQEKSPFELEDRPGFGAAGGIALGLSAFFPTNLISGPEYFFAKVGMEEKVKWADLVITGEGRYDEQSAEGKGSFILLQIAKKHAKPIHLITSGEIPGPGFDETIFLPPLPEKGDSESAKKFLLQSVTDFFKENPPE